MKNQGLKISVENERLCISIGVETLCHACEVGRAYGLGGVKITDKDAFIKSLALQLKSESEDGSTPVHDLFDQAVSELIENGEEGIEPEDDA